MRAAGGGAMEQRTLRHQRCSGMEMIPEMEMEMDFKIASINVLDQASCVMAHVHLQKDGWLFPCVSRDRCRAPLLESEISKRSPFLLDCQMRSLLTEGDARRRSQMWKAR